MTWLEKLTALLDQGEHLPSGEREAFQDMRDKLSGDEERGLTGKQAAWVTASYERLGLDGAKNLWSGGKVPRGRSVPAFDALVSGPKPLKPPGRR